MHICSNLLHYGIIVVTEVYMKDRMKLWIADQMRDLMKHKPIDKIRITEICRAADIERSTFYYHFRDKYDLVAWMFYYSAGDTNVIDLREASENIKKLKNDILFFRRAYEDTSQNALWQYIYEYFVKEYTDAAKSILGTDTLDTQLAFSIRLYCYGGVAMSKDWILNDNVTSAETVVSMMFNSMPDNMRKIYFEREAS